MKDILLPLKAFASAMGNIKNIRFFAILLILFIFSGETSFAVDATAGETGGDSSSIIDTLNGILAILASLLGLITALIGMFLNPGWTNGTLFDLQEYLRIIWILISNVVYFVFAFILIVIAFMNIIGKGEGNWELKQALPRFIVGVLIVPFSWFIVQFILSVSGVLTYAVLSLPYDVFQNETLFSDALDSELYDESICSSYVLYLTTPDEGYGDTVALGDGLEENFRCESEGDFVQIRDIISGENGQAGLQNSLFGIMSIYTYGILKVHEMDTISLESISDIKDLIDLGLDVVFNLLFVVVYLLLMVALLLALFTRGIKLWIFIMMSPIFGLMYFFGKDGMGESTKNYSFVDFVHLAFIPVYVSAALAFGLTFIFVASEGIRGEASNEDFEFIEVAGIKLTIKGPHGAGDETQLNPIGKLIIELFGIAILWIAVMTALSKSEHTKSIIKPIADFGDSMGKLAAAAPTYAPIIPTGGGPGSGMSIAGLGTFGSTLEAGMRSSATRRGSDFANEILPGGLDQVVRALQNQGRSINEGMMRNQQTAQEQNRLLINTLSRADWNNELRRNAAIETLIQMYPSREDDIRQINNYNDARRILPEIFHSSVPDVPARDWTQMMEGSTGLPRDDDSGSGSGTAGGTTLPVITREPNQVSITLTNNGTAQPSIVISNITNARTHAEAIRNANITRSNLESARPTSIPEPDWSQILDEIFGTNP